MGIKHFFYWFKNSFKNRIKNLGPDQNVQDAGVSIDHLMIDLNGIFHPSAQKIYKYGDHKPLPRLLSKPKSINLNKYKLQIKMFENVCEYIEKLINIVKPSKTIVLCVDGPAPLSKQRQQRQRRFLAARDKDKKDFKKFDSNCISPGTKFMDHLTKYIDWYIHKKISIDPSWKNLKIIFSTEKSPGEGEHKIINFIRKFGNTIEKYCIHGLDADLIMLALGTQYPNFWILREDIYNSFNNFFLIDIGSCRQELIRKMDWTFQSETPEEQVRKYLNKHGFSWYQENKEKKKIMKFNEIYAINDFIFMCFMVGNDFLPHIPSIEIIAGGIDDMLRIYSKVGKTYGHLTCKHKDQLIFQPLPVEIFLGTMASSNKKVLEDKIMRKDTFFPDPLLEKNYTISDRGYNLNFEQYKKDYYTKHFGKNPDIKTICHDYLRGMQWVLTYYIKGVPDWKWCFKYHYAPFAAELAQHASTFVFKKFYKGKPSYPFQQLLSILPPKSSELLPQPLSTLLGDIKSPLKKFCPSTFEVDISGKRQKWEGIVLLPLIDSKVLNEVYINNIKKVNSRDICRNKIRKSYHYSYSQNESFTFRSKYGFIGECKVNTTHINL
jgi:5'-3' exoribonuclease 1